MPYLVKSPTGIISRKSELVHNVKPVTGFQSREFQKSELETSRLSEPVSGLHCQLPGISEAEIPSCPKTPGVNLEIPGELGNA